MPSQKLLGPNDPPPFSVIDGTADLVLIADHAGRIIPERLNNLGLGPLELDRHIAWDIGIGAVAPAVAAALDATLIMQTYSRLVIDCNRRLNVPASIPAVSDGIVIPGNAELTDAEKDVRAAEIFKPYQTAIDQALNSKPNPVFIAMHSFTPVFNDAHRPWHVGILFDHDTGLPEFLFEILREEEDLCIGKNVPYTVSDGTDYTIPVHGEDRGIAHVAIEIRQDLIGHERGQREWADRMARAIAAAVQRLRAAG